MRLKPCPRACEAKPAGDMDGHVRTFLKILDLAGLPETRWSSKPRPNRHQRYLPSIDIKRLMLYVATPEGMVDAIRVCR